MEWNARIRYGVSATFSRPHPEKGKYNENTTSVFGESYEIVDISIFYDEYERRKVRHSEPQTKGVINPTDNWEVRHYKEEPPVKGKFATQETSWSNTFSTFDGALREVYSRLGLPCLRVIYFDSETLKEEDVYDFGGVVYYPTDGGHPITKGERTVLWNPTRARIVQEIKSLEMEYNKKRGELIGKL